MNKFFAVLLFILFTPGCVTSQADSDEGEIIIQGLASLNYYYSDLNWNFTSKNADIDIILCNNKTGFRLFDIEYQTECTRFPEDYKNYVIQLIHFGYSDIRETEIISSKRIEKIMRVYSIGFNFKKDNKCEDVFITIFRDTGEIEFDDPEEKLSPDGKIPDCS